MIRNRQMIELLHGPLEAITDILLHISGTSKNSTSILKKRAFLRFTCELFHPNIYQDGRVCISILHAPGDDPTGYESSSERFVPYSIFVNIKIFRWSPVQSIEKILLSVVSMLAEPNDESPANVNAAKMWREDRAQFERIADNLVRKTLCLPLAEN